MRPLLLLLLSSLLAHAEEPAIKQTSPTTFEIGLVKVDQELREIRLPAEVAITDSILEYLLVENQGKIHESLFTTAIDPVNLNIAFKLLDFRESPELFQLVDENHRPTGKYPEVPAELTEAAKLDILAEWKDGDQVISKPISELIQHTVLIQPLPAGPWLYTGSYIENGKYWAQATGNIIAIFTAQEAVVNYPGIDRDDDEVWKPNPSTIPPAGTTVTLVLKAPL